MVFWLLFAALVLARWLYKINEDYYILSFFSRRVRTNNDKPVESIVPIAQQRTVFGNAFDFFTMDDVSVFSYYRNMAKPGASYLQYGRGTPVFNIVDAENTEFVFNDQHLINKGLIYNFLQPALRTGLLTSSGKKWRHRRKMLTPTFNYNMMNQFQEIFRAESLKFVRQFRFKTESVVSLSELIPKFTLNTICETAMGVKLDDMAEKGDRYRVSFNMIEKCITNRLRNPLYWNNQLYNLFMAGINAPHLKVMHDFSSEIIAKRRVLFEEVLQQRRNTQSADDDICIPKPRFAMLDTLICAEKDGFIDNAGICEEVDTLMFEGFDTTSICLTFALMNMSLHPDKQELCYQEISEHIPDDLSNLDVNQVHNLKYLECFIKETMRLYPPVPLTIRQTARETELPNGLVLPPCSQINIHIFDIHRNPKYWEEPDKFDPERFLPENLRNRHTYAYVPFSAGQRNCIGQKFAMLEMKTFLLIVLKHFKILPVVYPKSLVFKTGITLRTKNNIDVQLVRRT